LDHTSSVEIDVAEVRKQSYAQLRRIAVTENRQENGA